MTVFILIVFSLATFRTLIPLTNKNNDSIIYSTNCIGSIYFLLLRKKQRKS